MPETTYEAALRVAKTNGATDQKPGQDDQAFMFSILKALSTCAQAEWDNLGNTHPTAHVWYQVAADANNKSVLIPVLDGFKPKIIIKTPPLPPPKPVIEVKKAEPPKTIPPSPPAPQRKEREKHSKNAGILDKIRETVIINQDWNAKKIHEYITKNGFPDASYAIVAVNVGDIKRVLLVVKALGYWKEKTVETKTT